MKLKNKLILSYSIIAIFLVLASIMAYSACNLICAMFPSMMHSGMTLFTIFSVIALIIALGISILLATKISNPIRVATAKTRAMAEGDYEEKIEIDGNTKEIAELIDSINHLATALKEQQESKRRMARDYAHEIRTPLAALQLNLEGFLDGVFERSDDRIESMRQEIIRISRMVEEIDKIVEIEDKTKEIAFENFDFSYLLKQTVITFEPAMKEKQIDLIVDMEPCEFRGDKNQIGSLFTNLISNAVKYTNEGGEIHIKAKEKNNNIVFSVLDNGIGIDDESKPHIFEHLYRADQSRTRESGGSGIGLAVVKAIVDAHEGTVQVESSQDKGSIFTVTLPKKKGNN